ncbi:hypothetical protein [Limnospira maxima]|nr:hypothetical protein [Limnospira maxima]
MGWVGADLPVLSVGIEIDSRTHNRFETYGNLIYPPYILRSHFRKTRRPKSPPLHDNQLLMDMGWVGADLPVLSVGIEIDSRTRPYMITNY